MSEVKAAYNVNARPSGRAFDQLRKVKLLPNYTCYAEGSMFIQLGNTQVICNASVLNSVPPFLKGKGQGWVTAEYGMLPRATHTRSSREAARGKQSGRTQEIQRLIGRSLRAVFDLNLLGERTIHIDCDVLQADGGTRCASITGAWLAAALAVQHLIDHSEITQNPILDHVAAVSVGIYNGQTILDLDYIEDSNCDADINVVMTGANNLVEIQGTAEGKHFNRNQLNHALDLAAGGIDELLELQKQILIV